MVLPDFTVFWGVTLLGRGLINYCLAKVVNNSSELGEKEVSGRLSPHDDDHIVLSTLLSRSMVSPNNTIRKEGKEAEAHPG